MSITLRTLGLTTLLLGAACGAFAQNGPKIDFPAPSPACTLKQRVGLTDFEIVYSRPSVKGREIFGSHEKYGAVWRTGANAATKITFSTPVKFNGTEVPAGTYGLFTIPGKDSWTVILNNDSGQWGAYKYDQSKDVARITAKPVALTQPVETMTIEFDDVRDESATLYVAWEKTRVPVTLGVDVATKLLPQIEKAMSMEGKKQPGLLFQASQFYFNHDQDLTKALTWIDEAIAGSPKAYYMVHLRAKILAKQGKKADAIAAAKQSLDLAREANDGAYVKQNEDLISSL